MAGPYWNNLGMGLRVDRRPALRQYQIFTARSQLGFAVLRSDMKGERNDDDTRWLVPRSVQLARGNSGVPRTARGSRYEFSSEQKLALNRRFTVDISGAGDGNRTRVLSLGS